LTVRLSGCHKNDANFASKKLGLPVKEVTCYSKGFGPKWLLDQAKGDDGSVVLLDYSKLTWHEGTGRIPP
jgi:hypothetical protein